MNEGIIFWKNWNKQESIIYWIAVILFFASLAWGIYQYFLGDSVLIGWTTEIDLESVNYYLDNVSNNFHVFPSEAYSYLNFVRYIGDDIKPTITESIIYFSVVCFALVLIISSLNALNKIWYYLGILFIILLFASFKLDLLQIINSQNALFAYLITVIAGLSYYYQVFNKNIGFHWRFLSFSVIIGLFIFIVFNFSKVPNPSLYLVSYGAIGLLIASLLFILMTATEIMEFFLLLSSENKASNKNIGLAQFIVFSVFYLAILGLTILKNNGLLELEMYYPNPIYFYPFAALLGLWGFKKRSFLLDNFFSFRQGTAYVYIGLGIITNMTIGYYCVSGNDSIIELFKYFITVSYLGLGLVYFIYVMFNFFPLFKTNYNIYKVVYHPTRFEYKNVIIFGLLNLIVLQFQDRFSGLDKGMAGYNNALGDVYYAEKNMLLAEQYYNFGERYDYYNHKSNYSLGCMARQKYLIGVSINYFANSLEKRPSAYSFANIADLNLKKERFFEAMFALRDGSENFPTDYHLYNNMALIFKKTNVDDSTLFYFMKAREFCNDKDLSPKANEVAFFAKNSYPYYDSLEYKKSNPNIVYLTNNYAYKTARNENYIKDFDNSFVNDSILNPATFGYLFNYCFNHIKSLDTNVISKVEKLTKNFYNEAYFEDLNFLLANIYYHNGKPQEGKKILGDLMIYSPINIGFYANQLGVWSIENNHYESAAEYFGLALKHAYQPAKEHYAIMLSETNKPVDAIMLFAELKTTEYKEIAERKLKVLLLKNFEEALDWTDDMKLELIHLRINEMNESGLKKLVNSIKSPAIEVLVAAELINFYKNKNEFGLASDLYQEMKNISNANAFETGELNYQYLSLLAEFDKLNDINLSKNLFLNKNREKERKYFEALAYYSNNQKEEAKQKFAEMRSKNLCIGKGISIYSELLDNNDSKYEILLEGIRILPNSVHLQKAYIMLCLEMNREMFSEETWERFKKQVSVKEFNEFASLYLKRKSEIEQMYQ
jgi:hypothetical protein